jgi:hypothetical protein
VCVAWGFVAAAAQEYDYGSEQDEVEDELVEIENVYYEADGEIDACRVLAV